MQSDAHTHRERDTEWGEDVEIHKGLGLAHSNHKRTITFICLILTLCQRHTSNMPDVRQLYRVSVDHCRPPLQRLQLFPFPPCIRVSAMLDTRALQLVWDQVFRVPLAGLVVQLYWAGLQRPMPPVWVSWGDAMHLVPACFVSKLYRYVHLVHEVEEYVVHCRQQHDFWSHNNQMHLVVVVLCIYLKEGGLQDI